MNHVDHITIRASSRLEAEKLLHTQSSAKCRQIAYDLGINVRGSKKAVIDAILWHVFDAKRDLGIIRDYGK